MNLNRIDQLKTWQKNSVKVKKKVTNVRRRGGIVGGCRCVGRVWGSEWLPQCTLVRPHRLTTHQQLRLTVQVSSQRGHGTGQPRSAHAREGRPSGVRRRWASRSRSRGPGWLGTDSTGRQPPQNESSPAFCRRRESETCITRWELVQSVRAGTWCERW